MGVLNLTPDSFSDGGRYDIPRRALRHAAAMVAAGADLLDLGAQSTRPGAEEVGPEQEWRRLQPVLSAVRASQPQLPLSVDTFQPAVAEAALAAGASWINDVRGANPDRRDPAMARLVAASGCPYVLMHSRGDSAGMDARAVYGDVVEEVRGELLQATEAAAAAGVAAERIVWDPGLGFAKTTEQNLALLRHLDRLGAEGFPLLVGPSRKRFIGAVLDQPRPRARIWGTAAVCAHAIGQGAAVLRVHDVAPISQIARMLAAIGSDPQEIA
ncbi:dihydropteroate synthase [Cyanobium sp. PCC 7001]|uniref:dihydropteroate synthase n=1 Tax=Cyanobium sp. PCC 7001 TaxID=180281 RepID=UPI00018049C6|nr:dihydropteroate synthase [Cyanobium sp. PCC 7001]EDY39658.1 dihydropteroate synthase [Cyanobium sp. PCC 7001]